MLWGLKYSSGEDVTANPEEAIHWFQKAAALGNVKESRAKARYERGIVCSNGKGTAKDDAEAVVWWRKAAEQNFALAQNNLGVMYDNGAAVAADRVEAYFWFNLSLAGTLPPDIHNSAQKSRDDPAAQLSQTALMELQERCRKWQEEHRAAE